MAASGVSSSLTRTVPSISASSSSVFQSVGWPFSRQRSSYLRSIYPLRRVLPAHCKKRHRNFSYQKKRRNMRDSYLPRSPVDSSIPIESDEDNSEIHLLSTSNHLSFQDDVGYNNITVDHSDGENSLPCDELSTELPHGSVKVKENATDELRKEIDILRSENESLKDDTRRMGERMSVLETEKVSLKSTMEETESKHCVSERRLSVLRDESKITHAKLEELRRLVDETRDRAESAASLLRQSRELQEKVERVEGYLSEVNLERLLSSSEELQRHNESTEQRMRDIDEHLKKSDGEIQACVQLYGETVKEFRETLEDLKRESRRRAASEPVDDMPSEFWSRLLVTVDRWMLEKKLSEADAKRLREMVRRRDARIRDAHSSCDGTGEEHLLVTFRRLASGFRRSQLYVVHVAAEMAPVAKVGGLGDVVTGLSKALRKKGHHVEIILPKYDCLSYEGITDLQEVGMEAESYFEGRTHKNKIWVGIVEGLPVYFIEPLHPSRLFWRGEIYGQHDDFERFSYFSRAALDLLQASGKRPDIIHCHDWQTAFVAPLYWDVYAPRGWNSSRICFTCHNFEHQGVVSASRLSACGLDGSQMNRQDRMQDHSAHDRINALKGGIVFSNIVTTVSPTYAKDARTPYAGFGLQSTLNSHSRKFIGILNGIDTDAWDPGNDPHLVAPYTPQDLHGKAVNKRSLCHKLALVDKQPQQPLVGCIARLVPQKGVHLIRHAIYRTLELGGQFVLLGFSPVSHIQKEFEHIANQLNGGDGARLILKYDEALAHLIYAASDMFVIPSIFEPCGLTQMIAMRYGSVPIVRKTGGLNDTVFGVDEEAVPVQFRNGFTFVNADERGVSGALERAFEYYRKEKGEGWEELVRSDMRIDLSWDVSASQYVELYEMAASRAREAQHWQ